MLQMFCPILSALLGNEAKRPTVIADKAINVSCVNFHQHN